MICFQSTTEMGLTAANVGAVLGLGVG